MAISRVTIKEVAQYAKTTKSTVSRVLTNSPRVSPETKTKVLEAVRILGYTPNKAAQSLKSGKNNILGLVVSQQQLSEVIMNPSYPAIIKSISERAQSEGYNILLITSAGTDIKSYENILHNHAVDGFILLGATIDDTLNELLDQMKVPYVFNMRYSETNDNCYVTFDDMEGGYTATKYLLDLGHRNMKLVVGDVKGKVLSFNLKRIAGFKRALEEYGVAFSDDMILKTRGDMESSYGFISNLFTRESPTALLLSNELTSIAALNALTDQGINVPGDVSLVAFGHSDFFRNTRPSLTTMSVNFEWQGFALVDMLLQQIEGHAQKPSPLIKKPEFVLRESTRRING